MSSGLEDQFQTGDILLFSHRWETNTWTNTFLSVVNWLVGYFTESKYTHSAIIVRDPKFTVEPLKGLYVLESSYENFVDVEDGELKLGVELEEYSKVVADWSGEIYWRQLKCQRDEEFYHRLAESHNIVHNRPYDIIPTDWYRAYREEVRPGVDQRKKTFWCSALVTFLYVQWGFLAENVPWSLITCKSLGSESGNQIPLQFINCQLEKEKLVYSSVDSI